MPRLALLSPRSSPLLAARQQWPSSAVHPRSFHASATRPNSNEAQNHYDMLELAPSASAADIKRQFYTLSKRHHPDHNKGDPHSSSRFVQISEAYHVLGSPEKRSRYDDDLARAEGRHHHHSRPAASYSGPAGSRPASGLSRRRTQFRGPPPSFYRNGAWGAHGAKRAANAAGGGAGGFADGGGSGGGDAGSSSSAGADANTSWGAWTAGGGSPAGGFGPGQAERGWDNPLPHWDRRAHVRTQEEIAARFSRRARGGEDLRHDGGGWSMLLNFFVVSGTIAFVVSIPSLLNNKQKDRARA